MLNEKIYVFDDIINLELQEKIKNVLISDHKFDGKDFPWYYVDDITVEFDDPTSQNRPAFTHEYVMYEGNQKLTGKQVSKFHSLFLPILQNACKNMNIFDINVLQGRSFLQFPLNLKDKDVDNAHKDIYDRDNFFVVLYYVCDSDGDTVIYSETDYSDTYTLKQKVTPKQGRVVIFDGMLMHTAEQPLNNRRCIVNYNLGFSSFTKYSQ